MAHKNHCDLNHKPSVPWLWPPGRAELDVGDYTISGEAEVGGLPRSFTPARNRSLKSTETYRSR
jgi:hypothetical protein